MKLYDFKAPPPAIEVPEFSPGPFTCHADQVLDRDGLCIATVTKPEPSLRLGNARLLSASHELFQLLREYVLADRCLFDRAPDQRDVPGHEACRFCAGQNILRRVLGVTTEGSPLITFQAFYEEQKCLRKHYEDHYREFRTLHNQIRAEIEDRIAKLRARQAKYDIASYAVGTAACARAIAELGVIGAILRRGLDSEGR